MADFSHSMQRTKPSATISKKMSSNRNEFTAKTVYDDVFGGPPQFGVPTLSSRIDDYSEIFGSFNSSRVSSIPILDLPSVDENDVSNDVRNSKFDYSEVFGGFNGWDFAVSYEELLAEPKGGESSSDDVWTSAETGSPSEGSSEDPACAENNQAFSNEESYQSLDGIKQFNMLYQKTNQISTEDGISATTHIAQVNSVPAFTFIVEESISSEKAERDKLVTRATKLCSVDADFDGLIMEEKHLKETMLDQPVHHTVSQISESDPKHKKSHLKEAMSEQPVCQQSSESGLKHKKSHLKEAMSDQQVCQQISESNLKNKKNHLKEAMSAQPVCQQISESDLKNKSHPKEAMSDQPVCQQISESELKHQRNHIKETLSDKPVCHTVTQISESDLIHQRNHGGNGTYRSKAFVTVSEINLRTVPLHVPPPSRPPPKVSIKRSVCDGSPPFFDVEVDASSSAAAAAMKDAMEKAQARLKSAKESMERKRDGLQNRKKLGLKDDIYVKERREGETTNEAHKLKEKAQGTFLRVDNEIKGFALEERQKSTRVVQAGPHFQVTGKHANEFTELVEQKYGEEFGSTQDSNEQEGRTGEWKVEEQYFELVKEDKFTAYMEDPKLKEVEQGKNKISAKDLNVAQEFCYWKEDENKLTVEIKREDHDKKEKVSPEREEHEKKLKESSELEEREKQLKQAREQEEYEMILKEIRKQEENEKKQREVREQEENEKREKMAREREENEKILKEACEQEENEKRKKEAHEREENAKRLKEAYELEESEKQQEPRNREREENEKRLREDCEREENEKRLNEAREKEENEKRRNEALEREESEKRRNEALERKESEKRINEARERDEFEKRLNEACEREENEKRLKEACEREENEKRLKEARKREENEKRLKEACERDGNEKRLKEAREWEVKKRAHQEYKREDNDKKLQVAQDALVCREDNKNSNKDSLESAESEKRLTVGNEVCKQDEDMNLNATRKTSKELDTDKFELVQISRDPEESGQLMETPTCASEHKENVRELKAAKRVLNEQDGINRLEVEHADQSAPEREDHENRKKVASDAMTQDNEKNLGQTQGAILQEKNERAKKPYQGALELDENNNKDKGAEGKKELVENGKKIEAAHSTNMVEQKGEKMKMGTGVSISQDTERIEKILSESLPMEQREKEERMQRESEREKERLRKLEEDREREREREKDRMAVERATREARERAFADARERAERAAVERATTEVRQRAMAEARERLEKASAEAREKSLAEKASIEARLRAERAAVERATAEARERAVEKARAEKPPFHTRGRAERTFSEKFSTTLRDNGMRRSSSFSDLPDSQFQSSGSSTSYASEKFQGAEIESAQRCKARLERHQRTVERAAKALAEKNMRDLLAQREQSERNRFAETLDAEVKRWSSGKEGNLRALLSTLQYILGPDSGWQPIPLTEVITAVAVKKAFRKATLCVHPDKLQQRGASIQQKYVCEKVFDLLKEAWNKFNSEER